MSHFAEVDHPRDKTGRFSPGTRPNLYLAASNDVRIAADQDWPTDEPDVVPDDEPFCGGETTWKGAGFSPNEADNWLHAGITDPELAQRIHSACPDLDLRKFQTMYGPSTNAPDPRDAYTVGEAVNNGEVLVSEIRGVLAEPSYDPETDPF